ncbi:hypothetical protein ETD86_47255 [Nonomuraea turkmeniaca]|uniref:DUF2690 domain-containing protein n=1 Tax=Nonomuraea turkmeniaca TaxID=103838 RepID=A0A5S4EY02_9ACTN|nr:hypothetical protein [Nonomuraea turkmeniaca]TMR08563.1 hypothetical protein ETD86_47255 [Nonomuraea turkmeniaca]
MITVLLINEEESTLTTCQGRTAKRGWKKINVTTNRRLGAIALAVACAAVPLITFSTSAAQADTSSTTSVVGQTRCQNHIIGVVCATWLGGSPGGYDAAFTRNWAGTATVRFQLVCGPNTFYDHGWFSISQNQRRSFVFAVGNQGPCKVAVLDRAREGRMLSPMVYPL